MPDYSHDISEGLVRSTDEARQGVTGHNVRFVLGFGLAGVIVAFLGIVLVMTV